MLSPFNIGPPQWRLIEFLWERKWHYFGMLCRVVLEIDRSCRGTYGLHRQVDHVELQADMAPLKQMYFTHLFRVATAGTTAHVT
jgi:hypothetical protein